MDSTKFSKLLFLPAYQNQGTLTDYMDPWISLWTEEFLKEGLSEETKKKILESYLADEDLEDVVRIQPDIVGFENDLLLDWAKFVMKSPEKLEIIKKELHDYFFWKDEPAEFYDWQTEEGMPETPEEALEWYKEIFDRP